MRDAPRYDNLMDSEVSFHFPSTSRLCEHVSTHAGTLTGYSVASMPIHARLLFSLLAVRLIEQRQIESKVYFSAVARGEESTVVGGSQFSRMCVRVCVY